MSYTYSLAKEFGPFLRGFGKALEKRRVLFLVTTSTFAVSTGLCRVACPLPASRVDKPLVRQGWRGEGWREGGGREGEEERGGGRGRSMGGEEIGSCKLCQMSLCTISSCPHQKLE